MRDKRRNARINVEYIYFAGYNKQNDESTYFESDFNNISDDEEIPF